MSNRVAQLTTLCCLLAPMFACSAGDEDDGMTFGSFTTFPTTTTTTTDNDTEEGDGDGDGDGDPTTTTTGDGDGDGDPTTTTTGDGDGDPGCTPGDFGCVCSNGLCQAGLVCEANVCVLGGGDGDGDGDPTTGGGNDPWDPVGCTDTIVTVTDLPGSVCSADCVGDLDCPSGPAGTSPACALILDGAVDPSNCALVCDRANDTCPGASNCEPVPNQPGVGLCMYP